MIYAVGLIIHVTVNVLMTAMTTASRKRDAEQNYRAEFKSPHTIPFNNCPFWPDPAGRNRRHDADAYDSGGIQPSQD